MKKYFYLSFIAHGLLFLLLINTVNLNHSIGEKYIIIPAQVTTLSSSAITAPQKTSPRRLENHLAKSIKLRRAYSSPVIPPRPEGSPLGGQAGIHLEKSLSKTIGKKSNLNTEFLKIIHNEIAAHQHYPSRAILLNQSGTVTLQFNISPNGRIDQITILKSSGFSNLDRAALEALQSIANFKQASLYLKKMTTFSVDVIFA